MHLLKSIPARPPAPMRRLYNALHNVARSSRDAKARWFWGIAGGPARGFSQIMPSFDAVLSARQIAQVIQYLRALCREPGWPIGELNVPRALVTEKAFPESEVGAARQLQRQFCHQPSGPGPHPPRIRALRNCIRPQAGHA
jgi:hypothetical protein